MPVETSLAKPMPRSAARDSSEPRMPPLCDTSEIRPGGSSPTSSAPVAESMMPSVRLTKPMVLGPSSRMEPAASRNACWRRAPSGLASP